MTVLYLAVLSAVRCVSSRTMGVAVSGCRDTDEIDCKMTIILGENKNIFYIYTYFHSFLEL